MHVRLSYENWLLYTHFDTSPASHTLNSQLTLLDSWRINSQFFISAGHQWLPGTQWKLNSRDFESRAQWSEQCAQQLGHCSKNKQRLTEQFGDDRDERLRCQLTKQFRLGFVWLSSKSIPSPVTRYERDYNPCTKIFRPVPEKYATSLRNYIHIRSDLEP